VLSQRVGGRVDVFRLTSLVDRQRLSQLVGVSFHLSLDALRLVAELTLHRLEVLQHVRLAILHNTTSSLARLLADKPLLIGRGSQMKFRHHSMSGVELWPPYVIGGHYIFCPVVSFFFLSSFFPRIISAAAGWMSTILWQMVWP